MNPHDPHDLARHFVPSPQAQQEGRELAARIRGASAAAPCGPMQPSDELRAMLEAQVSAGAKLADREADRDMFEALGELLHQRPEVIEAGIKAIGRLSGKLAEESARLQRAAQERDREAIANMPIVSAPLDLDAYNMRAMTPGILARFIAARAGQFAEGDALSRDDLALIAEDAEALLGLWREMWTQLLNDAYESKP